MYLATMVLYLLLLVLNTNVRAEPTQLETCTEDYYWRSYTGCIPKNAFPGGTDKEGRPTYIGRTIDSMDEDILVPGELDPSTKTLSYEMDEAAHTTHKHIEILCIEKSDQFQWIKSHVPHNEEYLVKGGYKMMHNNTYFIGRTDENGRLVVGDVYDGGFYFVTDDGVAGYKEENFEILSHNHDAN